MSLTFNNNTITLGKTAFKIGISKFALSDTPEDDKFVIKVSGFSGNVNNLLVRGSWRSYGPYTLFLSPTSEREFPANMDLTLDGYRNDGELGYFFLTGNDVRLRFHSEVY